MTGKLSADTNEKGVALFENVPVNNYIIQIDESKNYLPNEKRLDIVQEKTIQPLFKVYIELKPQTDSFVECYIVDEQDKPVNTCSVTALLLKAELDREVGSYLYDLLQEKNDKYEAKLIPGEYLLFIKSPGYEELNEYIAATRGVCEKRFILPNKKESKLCFKSLDINTGKILPKSSLKLSTASGTLNVEGLTDSEGKEAFKTEGCGKYLLTVSREGYLTYTEELFIHKNSPEDVSVALLPSEEEFSDTACIRLCLSSNFDIIRYDMIYKNKIK